MNLLSLLPRRAWIVVLLPLLGGCSALRLTYGQGPALAYWWLDGYVDFSSEQAPRARAALDDWFVWHRASELADYAALLSGVQRAAVDKVTPEQVCGVLGAIEQRLARAFDQAVPAVAAIARELSPEQLRHLEQRYAKSDDELSRDLLRRPAAERQERSLKRWQERLESFYGPLDDVQRRMLADALAVSPFDAQRWLDERRLRQAEIVAGLRRLQAERADWSQVQAALRMFAEHAARSPRADYRAYRERLNEANCTLVARLHNTSTAAQRRRAIDKLGEWEADLRALARPAPAARVAAPG